MGADAVSHPPFFFCNGRARHVSPTRILPRSGGRGSRHGAGCNANVRNRWLLSEASWSDMAARSERSETMRAKLIEEKASERAALEQLQQGQP
jgi:hypothetical protein